MQCIYGKLTVIEMFSYINIFIT